MPGENKRRENIGAPCLRLTMLCYPFNKRNIFKFCSCRFDPSQSSSLLVRAFLLLFFFTGLFKSSSQMRSAVCYASLAAISSDIMMSNSTWLRLQMKVTKAGSLLRGVWAPAQIGQQQRKRTWRDRQACTCYLLWPLLADCAMPCRAVPIRVL